MSILTSVVEDLLKALPQLHPQIYFKSSLTALSHAMEDQILAGTGADQPLVIANFQQERFYQQEASRYLRIASLSPHVYVLAAPESSFESKSQEYETIAFEPEDELSNEWHLVVISQAYASCLICRECPVSQQPDIPELLAMDQARRFEGIWTFDRQVSCQAAQILLDRILVYRPELQQKIASVQSELLAGSLDQPLPMADPDPFAQRLVTYLQAGQYKLLKAYRSISDQERRERLINSITLAIRQSLHTEEIFNVAVRELGIAMQVCRCLIYRCKAQDYQTVIQHELLGDTLPPSLEGQRWTLQNNPLFQQVRSTREPVAIADTETESTLDLSNIQDLITTWHIKSWLMVPVLYQGRLLGIVELHNCRPMSHEWEPDEISLVEAIATQLGVAVMQAESYTNLEDLNIQLEALERTRSNLIAITGHELRTPLSTIQVCLESLSSEPDMPLELRQVMLSTALGDADRMRTLIQDFLTLSRLESGRVVWNIEPLAIEECVDLALSSIRTKQGESNMPNITATVPMELPLVRADGEWLVEVLSKLLDNACKFTQPEGQVSITATQDGSGMLEVTIQDTGRGIEPNRLETVFERFYQEEGALRRTAGGTGLGLAICRQIVAGLGGKIWAESAGREQGSKFHFTIPTFDNGTGSTKSKPEPAPNPKPPSTKARTSKRRSSRRSTKSSS